MNKRSLLNKKLELDKMVMIFTASVGKEKFTYFGRASLSSSNFLLRRDLLLISKYAANGHLEFYW